jgi:hypothetical protein
MRFISIDLFGSVSFDDDDDDDLQKSLKKRGYIHQRILIPINAPMIEETMVVSLFVDSMYLHWNWH